jgi:hypothetical protein
MQRIINVAILGALLWGGPTGCTREGHEVVVMMATGLDSVNRSWEKSGKPNHFDPMSVIQSSSERYYVFTNDVRSAGVVYHCRFAARSERIQIPGALVITGENILLWIRDRDGKIVVSPLQNGIE